MKASTFDLTTATLPTTQQEGQVPITVTLETERGETLVVLDEPYPEPAAASDSSRFPLLDGIDPYGDTAFNRLQMPRLADELHDLLTPEEGSQHSSCLTQIALLCQRGATRPHQYLWFTGD